MQKRGKLELIWIGKYDKQEPLEPRILLEKPELSYGNTDSGNMLIHGDNLLALRALEQDFAGKVKCIYIDPPYNTGSAFEHYDDGLEHSEWLCMMRPRLEILRNLMSDDGNIWISIDDDEQAYLKVMCDEVFGRANFVTICLWQKIHSLKNDAKYLSENHDYILVYAKSKENVRFNLLSRTEEMNKRYQNPDNDPRGPWQSGDLVANEERANGYYDVVSPRTGKVFNVQKGKHWVYSQENMEQLIKDNRIWFGKYGTAFPRKKRFLSDVTDGRKGDTWWASSEVGHNQEAKREIIKVFGSDGVFATPKPERLIERIFTLGSNPNDLVLDSFLGSGTTAAVAHKMGRRWIGIELGEHAYTHCKVRLDKVVDGEQGGISKAMNWQGGGGYKFYELAPSLLEKHPILPVYRLNKEYTFDMLCEAICKLEGFIYKPEGEMHGHSSESRFIHISREFVSGDYIKELMKGINDKQSVLIYGVKVQSNLRLPDNVDVKKIPKDLLKKCKFECEVR